MSTLGHGVPSPIPAPGSGVAAEFVPGRSLPPGGVPHYLKPIRINTRNILAVLRSYTRGQTPQISRWLYSTWNAQAEAVKYQEIRNALRDGEFREPVLSRWQQEYAAMIRDRMDPTWRAAWERSQGLTAENIRTATGKALNIALNYSRDWAEQHGGELAVNLSRAQQDALRVILRHFIAEEPKSAEELSRIVRATVGLTPKQAAQVAIERSKLIQTLTDQGLFGGELAKKVEHEIGNYAAWLHRKRALRIAQTELTYAYNYGQFAQIKDAQAAGLFAGGHMVKIWDATLEHSCAFCQSMHGQEVGLEETFPNLANGTSYCPPAHPWCACGITYELRY